MMSKVMTTPKLTKVYSQICWAMGKKDGDRDEKDGVPLQKNTKDQYDKDNHCQYACDVALMFVKEKMIWSGIFWWMVSQPKKTGRSNDK